VKQIIRVIIVGNCTCVFPPRETFLLLLMFMCQHNGDHDNYCLNIIDICSKDNDNDQEPVY
jgi:hypothetical protein